MKIVSILLMITIGCMDNSIIIDSNNKYQDEIDRSNNILVDENDICPICDKLMNYDGNNLKCIKCGTRKVSKRKDVLINSSNYSDYNSPKDELILKFRIDITGEYYYNRVFKSKTEYYDSVFLKWSTASFDEIIRDKLINWLTAFKVKFIYDLNEIIEITSDNANYIRPLFCTVIKWSKYAYEVRLVIDKITNTRFINIAQLPNPDKY